MDLIERLREYGCQNLEQAEAALFRELGLHEYGAASISKAIIWVADFGVVEISDRLVKELQSQSPKSLRHVSEIYRHSVVYGNYTAPERRAAIKWIVATFPAVI